MSEWKDARIVTPPEGLPLWAILGNAEGSEPEPVRIEGASVYVDDNDPQRRALDISSIVCWMHRDIPSPPDPQEITKLLKPAVEATFVSVLNLKVPYSYWEDISHGSALSSAEYPNYLYAVEGGEILTELIYSSTTSVGEDIKNILDEHDGDVLFFFDAD